MVRINYATVSRIGHRLELHSIAREDNDTVVHSIRSYGADDGKTSEPKMGDWTNVCCYTYELNSIYGLRLIARRVQDFDGLKSVRVSY